MAANSPAQAASSPLEQSRSAAVEPTVFMGRGFDACSAPSLKAMRAWAHGASPYGAVGIYISGRQRGCEQTHLTADWISQVRELGWRLMPTHVGRQPPCSERADSQQTIDPAHATQQGREEAAEAFTAARNLGLGRGTPVYLDLEAYPLGSAGCAQAVIDFTLGWTQGLHSAGYLSGFYSSTLSGVTDLLAARRAGAAPMPDALWYARWNDKAATDGDGLLRDNEWSGHRRAHQYHGKIKESHGGVSLTIDQNQLDTVVAG
ncbi:DUF1906 domain-containing protein [Streptomyces sp. RKAG293]|uniref:DUF1906 domain-containing protein n=1 Tax=Streptomyces sp. RKAG293 TaxID=2893403 RepID=UPI002034214E|nr:DUF1906 domain-containing protein [Streptomyces sp. RKAG293]MCM2422712.1 DUF1906 domain-containing protein [Streptomyces sp. RKAG293]